MPKPRSAARPTKEQWTRFDTVVCVLTLAIAVLALASFL